MVSGPVIKLNCETNPNPITLEKARDIIEDDSTPSLSLHLTRTVIPEIRVIELGRNPLG